MLAAGCSVSVGGRLGELKRIAKTCPDGKQLAVLVSLDVRGELRGSSLAESRTRAIGRSATQTAVCGGRLRVVVFSASSVASVVVFDGELRPVGATENARLRRVDGMVRKTMGAIAAAMPVAVARVSSRGGDPVGQLEIAQEYAVELGDEFGVHVVIETSGLTRGLAVTGLDRATAVRLAGRVSVPDLSGIAVLTFAGLGRVGSGAPPSTMAVAGLRAYYERLCVTAKAGSCRATSDIDPIGA